MPTFIVKPKRDEDFYVEWSTVVDCPTGYGSLKDLVTGYSQDSGRVERFERADEFGTSMCDPAIPRESQWFGWDDEEFIVRNIGSRDGLISRVDVRALCERLALDADVSDLLKPFPQEEEN